MINWFVNCSFLFLLITCLANFIAVFVVIVFGIDGLKVHEIVGAALTELFYCLPIIFVVYRHYIFESTFAFVGVLIASRLIYFTSGFHRSDFLAASQSSIAIR